MKLCNLQPYSDITLAPGAYPILGLNLRSLTRKLDYYFVTANIIFCCLENSLKKSE